MYKKIFGWSHTKGQDEAIIETASGNSITYLELLSSIEALAQYFGNKPLKIILATQAGITNSIIWLTSLIFGYLLIPVSPELTQYEFDQLYKKHKPDLFISEVDKIENNSKIKQIFLRDIEKIINTGNKHKKKAGRRLYIIDGNIYLSTSGSTGNPKGIILSVSKIIVTAENIINSHKLTEKDRGLTMLPFYHVNAPIVSLISTIVSGGTLIITPKYSTTHFWEWVEKYQPTWISIVPTIAAMLLSTEKPEFLDKSLLRFIRTASAPLPRIIFDRFEKKFHIPLIETYGISEAASTIAANPVPPGKHKAGSVGLPIGISMKICDPDTSKEVSQGNIGEIWIKGKQVISSYESNEDVESFMEGWFKTGDLGYFDNEGYLYLIGRKKDVIIRGGENISPREVEEVILTFPNVHEAAVVGLPDPIYGEQVAAFIVIGTETKKNIVDKINIFIEAKLSKSKRPAHIFILDKLPRGKTGKIDKKALKSYTNNK